MRYRNSTHALLGTLSAIEAHGTRLEVRGAFTTECRNQVVELERPSERCIISPGRLNNTFASIAETMWVIAGRNDVRYLEYYLPRAREFSDDGSTWRAGYGPRLRNWKGTDQVAETVRLLKEEQGTRRAVISLFDPSQDYQDTRDVPCNNWLHMLVRDQELHVNVAIRSNDLMWGFSGINVFEWSVLQEFLAYWLGVKIGDLTFFVSSLHLYDHHLSRAHSIGSQFPGSTCYDLGLVSPEFRTPWPGFQEVLDEWFDTEEALRAGSASAADRVQAFRDPLLRHFLEALLVYNKLKQDVPIGQILEYVALLPATDLVASIYEYISRQHEVRIADIAQPAVAEFWRRYTTHGRFKTLDLG